MSDAANFEIPIRKKRTTNKRALKQKNPSPNDANILAQKLSQSSPGVIPVPSDNDPEKENHESLSQPRSSPKKSKAKGKASKGKKTLSQSSPAVIPVPSDNDPEKENHESLSQPRSSPKKAKAKGKASKGKQQSFENELLDLQDMLQKLRLEKEKTEDLLKEKDEILKAKEEELETRGKEQEKLQVELKKLQKLKEFKPTVSFPISMNNEEDKNEKKKKGCPDKKRPSTPYILWCKDQWNEIKKNNPEAEFKEISNILGAKWKNVTAEEKKPYEEKYKAEKEAYLQVMAKDKREKEAMKLLEEELMQKTAMELLEQYVQFKQEAEKENKKAKKEKDPLKPKHPMSAFFLFSNERRAALIAGGKSFVEIAKIAGEEWKNMTEEQKAPYEKESKKNKEKYSKEMEVYKQKKEEEVVNLKMEEEELMKLQKQEALQLLKKKEKTDNIIKKTKEKRQKKKQQNADPNRPKRPATSFLLFSKEARKNLLQERPGINNSTLTALISLKWKELNEEEKQVWNAEAAEAMKVYKKELEEYNKPAAAANME